MIARLYRATIWLFPADFRDRFEAELLDTAEQLERDRRGTWSTLTAFGDVIGTAIALRLDGRAPIHDDTHPSASAMQSLAQDVRFALRGLRRDPVFALFAIATLGLGIGANAAMFGIVDRLLLRGPDHVVNANQVVRVYVSTQNPGMRRFTGSDLGYVSYDLFRHARTFSAAANYANSDATIGRGAGARPAKADWVSGSFFNLLGVRPRLGRFFGEADDDAAAKVAVVSVGTWQRELGGREDAIGQTLIVNDELYTVVGVAPAGFTGADIAPVDVWVPMTIRSQRSAPSWRTSWSAEWLTVIGRVAPGQSADQVGAELTRILRANYTGNSKAVPTATVSVAPLNADENGSEATEARVARWLMGVSIVMLLIVCANVINLLLARAVRRGREIAIRLALGASKGRLRRLLLIESLMLGLGGAAVGVVIAYVLGGVARQSLLSNVAWTSSPVDGRVLVVSAVVAVVAGLLVGLIPAIRASATNLTSSLKTGAGEGGGRRARLRTGLTIAQAALSVSLLIGAGLFVRSLMNARGLHLGIEADRALIVELRRASLASLAEGPTKDAERGRRKAFSALAIDRLATLPGVEHAAVAVGMPFGNRFTNLVRIPGRDSLPRVGGHGPSVSAVTYDYFATVGTRILRGRGFLPSERAGTERVAVISALMAKTIWPGVDPIGQCVIAMLDTLPCARIVGIAEDTHRDALREDPSMHFYIPLGQEVGFGGSVLLVRGTSDPRALEPAIRRTLMSMDGSLTYIDMSTVQDKINPQIRPWRLGTAVLTGAGILALLVAVVGIYSVTSYLVTLRRREIGVRVALGANVGDILRLVVTNGLFTAGVGALIGCVVAFAGGNFIQPLLFDESSRDPVVFIGVTLGLLAASMLACVIPAIRANRISPVEALQSD